MSTNGKHRQRTVDADPPNAPGYTALRVAADWASAVRDEPLHLAYDAATGRVRTAAEGEAELTLLTTAYARRPRVSEVDIEIDTHAGDVPVTARFTLPGDEASALFWGESAVEKFLVPYYASAAAGDAPGFLARLYDAWYGYPAGVVQVCALAYRFGTRAPAPGTNLSLGATVGLLCLERATATLTLLSLDEFTARYTGGQRRIHGTEAPGPTGNMRGWRVTEQVESIVARDVAEFVSGLRGHFVTFQSEGDTLFPELHPTELLFPAPVSPPGSTFRLAALATSVRPDRPAPARVAVRGRRLDGGEFSHDVVARGTGVSTPDSMFWSDGGVEKLLLPYYASVKGSTAPVFTELLMGRWEGRFPPGDPQPDLGAGMRQRLADALAGSAPRVRGRADEEPESHVYTVTHLPRSEYAETEALESRTVLLAVEDGRTAAYTVRGKRAGARRPAQGRAAGGAAPAKRSRKRTSRAR